MNLKFLASACAAACCCVSCVIVDYKLGGSVIPIDQTYKIHTAEEPIKAISMEFPDSLSGYSQTRITIGAIRDEHFGLTTRASLVSIVPMYDTLDFGTDPKVKKFHFAASQDTVNCLYESQRYSLQNVKVYPLLEPIRNYDITTPVAHGSNLICKGTPVIDGKDSLSFDFTADYASQFLTITQEELDSLDLYLKRFPGIYLETDVPYGNGGRINCFNLQLGYDSSYYTLTDSFASLTVETMYDSWTSRKDTTFYFYFSPAENYDIDSLLTNSSTGSFPQYCMNLASHETRSMSGPAKDIVYIEGGGGLKPRIPAVQLKNLADSIITAAGADPKNVVINKATIVLPFEFPENYKDMDFFPYVLSPTCRIMTDTSAVFIGLTDASNSSENQGDIDRSNLQFAPDITYHLQELLKIKDTDETKKKRLENGSYDIWLLIEANEVTTTSSSSSDTSDLSEYYQYLAYQSYYNSMYGGYGYGSSSSSYSNYYTYMMMAQMYGSSGSTQTTTQMLDKDRYYYGHLNGPAMVGGRVPELQITFSVPNE